MVTLIQWSSLQKSVSKFTPKKYHEIDSRCLYVKGTLGMPIIVSILQSDLFHCYISNYGMIGKKINVMLF